MFGIFFTFILHFEYSCTKMESKTFREKIHKGGAFMIYFILKGIGMATFAVLCPLYPLFMLVLFLLSPVGIVTMIITKYAQPHHLSLEHKSGT